MKKVILFLAICIVVSACGGNSKKGGSDSSAFNNESAKTAESNVDTNSNKTGEGGGGSSAESPGAKLIVANDCLTCHKIDTKVIGPAYKDVAAKYPATDANIDMLANKVIKGGKGNWGDIPMSAHPTLSLADAKEMVKYILSLKK